MRKIIKQAQYAPWIKFLHWSIALAVIPMVLGSFYLEDIPKLYRGTAIMLHKSLGFTVLCLMLLRVLSIYFTRRPALPKPTPRWEKILSRFVQYSLYLVLILMPLSGWIMSTAAGKMLHLYGLITLPFPGITENYALSDQLFKVHTYLACTIIALLSLHIAGALKHYFYNKDAVLQSMLPSFHR